MQDKAKLAVQASLDGNWEEAVEYNTQILMSEPDNIAALNRLGRAYIELDQKDSAKEIYQRVISLDKYNPVALRGLKTLPVKKISHDMESSSETFIEEPGLTKSTPLIKLASRDVLLATNCRQPLTLVPRGRLVALKTTHGQVLGCLPDDLSLLLGSLLKSGYHYHACIKSVTDSQVTVFLREVKRPGRVTAAPSFSRTLHFKKIKSVTAKKA